MFRSFLQAVQFSLVALPALFLLTACGSTGPSSYVYSQEVNRMFEPPPTLLPNHTYYYIGTPVEPDAIIAIDNQFTMVSKVWAKVDISQKILDDWAFWFDNYIGWWSCPYRGALLLAPDGRQVGVGYSRWTFSVVKMPTAGAIVVYPPQALGSCRRRDILEDNTMN